MLKDTIETRKIDNIETFIENLNNVRRKWKLEPAQSFHQAVVLCHQAKDILFKAESEINRIYEYFDEINFAKGRANAAQLSNSIEELINSWQLPPHNRR